ncbi:MAG TPA: phosphatase PAP2 family protein [Miltoncostaeaceae bacterium]|nr:phosphatase PAP2 family protein [Miltoncostaeaceae bacterium]
MIHALRLPLPRRRPWLGEIMLFAAALLVYQGSRALVIGDPATAFRNARGVMGLEKAAGVFVEPSVQRALMDHEALVSLLNQFYMSAHWVVTPLFFVWLYRRRRHAYAYVRNAFLVGNAVALAVFMLFPVAPPRLAGAHEGFVDTLHTVSGVDLHGGMLSGWFNPNAAVPSMHFGYAFLIGVVGVTLVRGPLARVALAAYPALVLLTIVGTANHYVLDAAAGGAVMLLGLAIAAAWPARAARARHRSTSPSPRHAGHGVGARTVPSPLRASTGVQIRRCPQQ